MESKRALPVTLLSTSLTAAVPVKDATVFKLPALDGGTDADMTDWHLHTQTPQARSCVGLRRESEQRYAAHIYTTSCKYYWDGVVVDGANWSWQVMADLLNLGHTTVPAQLVP